MLFFLVGAVSPQLAPRADSAARTAPTQKRRYGCRTPVGLARDHLTRVVSAYSARSRGYAVPTANATLSHARGPQCRGTTNDGDGDA